MGRLEWEVFSHHNRFALGDDFRVKFFSDLWCGTIILKDAFLFIFRLACLKEASIADLFETFEDQIYWNINFSRAAQDWEV